MDMRAQPPINIMGRFSDWAMVYIPPCDGFLSKTALRIIELNSESVAPLRIASRSDTSSFPKRQTFIMLVLYLCLDLYYISLLEGRCIGADF